VDDVIKVSDTRKLEKWGYGIAKKQKKKLSADMLKYFDTIYNYE